MAQPGAALNLNDVASELGMTRQTVSLYLDYLEKSFLIIKLYNYSKNQRTSEKKLKKYYPTILPPELLTKDELGSILETAVVIHTKAKFFWRDARKNEVDIIDTKQDVLPIEVKSGKIETKGISAFMKKFKIDKGYIITIDEQKSPLPKSITLIPAYEFLSK